MRSLILGRSVGKKKGNIEKLEKECNIRGAWSVISVEPGNNMTWLQSQHGGNRGWKNQRLG